ncbi:hypothetical protein CU669_19860 [Paramagnetospirillum kuznetsovii]|uniref:OmpA-like domain-containing protein n=1 Tax=Paramagnetospirillum kuznetsovii TaxID=2053833 RepID=A0A364NST3_9PROT|nr:hypothetical protein [Paramagnetospirillum kuznetsovii]RAU20149.1 hypothetical protein CU669_19860 [Paramagnetospirillum kuznetsovii]
MLDCIEAWRLRHERHAIIVGKSVVAAALIAGCSWVPDAANPVEWYKGIANTISSDETPEIASPRRPDGSFPDVTATPDQARKPLPKGLSADRENSKYAESVKREPAPTKQLAKRTQPAQTQVAQASPGQSAAAQNGKGGYQPSLDRRMQGARDDGPNAPPSTAPGGPPARADVPDYIPTKRTVLSDHYAKRLAESAAATNKNDPFATVPPPRSEASYNQPVHTYAVPANAPVGYGRAAYASDVSYGTPDLVAPRGTKAIRGTKGVSVPSGPAASFEVAAVQFGRDGGLTAADRAALKQVAQLQRQSGGVVRVLGLSSSGPISFVGGDDEEVATQRANMVAKALTGMGVPARKVLVAADTASGGYDDSGARVSIEY